ncbi:hypothetical protein AB7M17_005516 [Bradyrhizobium sp. USDA 377]
MASLLCRSARLASCDRGRLRRLPDGNQAQSEQRCARLAFYPDRSIDQATCRSLAQFGRQIDQATFGINPTRALPAGPDHEVRAGIDETCHALRLQISAVAKTDFAGNHRYPVQRLARSLIGQLEVTKALLRKIERAVYAPHRVLVPAARPSLRDRRGVNNADQAAVARLRRTVRQCLTYQLRQPISALTQPIQQSHVGDIDKAHRRGPCRRQPQTSLAKAIRQDQAQQIHRIADLPRADKRLRLARANVERFGAAKPGDNTRPVLVHKRFVCHPNLESQANPTRKPYFCAHGRRPGPIRREEVGTRSSQLPVFVQLGSAGMGPGPRAQLRTRPGRR